MTNKLCIGYFKGCDCSRCLANAERLRLDKPCAYERRDTGDEQWMSVQRFIVKAIFANYKEALTRMDAGEEVRTLGSCYRRRKEVV